ncbi:MAG: response regulator [Thermoleophilia bacterium]
MSGNGQKTILIVDDNDDVRRLVKKVLQKSGYRVLEADTGAGALAIAEETVPDLVLMDLRLPGELNGLETTGELKEDPRTSRVPVVALTASVMERDRKQALAAGCSGFLGKPIDITALPQQVAKFIMQG